MATMATKAVKFQFDFGRRLAAVTEQFRDR
jgi:hypothetical protein